MTTTVLGMTLWRRIRSSVCVFPCALTFMYISARAVDDAEYRAMFFDPLIDDSHTRPRATATATTCTAPCCVDAGHVDDCSP